MDQLEHRIATLKIDLKQTFPKRADGVVDCGTNTDCFLVMAHRCEPAMVEHRLSEPGLLTVKKVHARYRIAGADGERCKVLRLVLAKDMELPDEARKVLLKKGRTASEVDALEADALVYLEQRLPDRTVCTLPRSKVLGLGLALLVKEPLAPFFRPPCHDPREGDAWPTDFVAPAVPAPGAAPAEPPAEAPSAAPAAAKPAPADAPPADAPPADAPPADAPKAKTAQ